MLKRRTTKKSKDINKLAAFIVNAITQNESALSQMKERRLGNLTPGRLWEMKESRAFAEKKSAKIRGKIALKAALERWSQSHLK